jgi:hypothetical protein
MLVRSNRKEPKVFIKSQTVKYFMAKNVQNSDAGNRSKKEEK